MDGRAVSGNKEPGHTILLHMLKDSRLLQMVGFATILLFTDSWQSEIFKNVQLHSADVQNHRISFARSQICIWDFQQSCLTLRKSVERAFSYRLLFVKKYDYLKCVLWKCMYSAHQQSTRKLLDCVTNRQIFILSCRKFQSVWQMSCNPAQKSNFDNKYVQWLLNKWR